MRVLYEMDIELWELWGLGLLLGVVSNHRVSGSTFPYWFVVYRLSGSSFPYDTPW